MCSDGFTFILWFGGVFGRGMEDKSSILMGELMCITN